MVLYKEAAKYIQKVAGTFLFHGRAIHSTILTPLSAIASQQSAPTEETMKEVKYVLDYCAYQEDTVIT